MKFKISDYPSSYLGIEFSPDEKLLERGNSFSRDTEKSLNKKLILENLSL
jgi:hypothetical protein